MHAFLVVMSSLSTKVVIASEGPTVFSFFYHLVSEWEVFCATFLTLREKTGTLEAFPMFCTWVGLLWLTYWQVNLFKIKQKNLLQDAIWRDYFLFPQRNEWTDFSQTILLILFMFHWFYIRLKIYSVLRTVNTCFCECHGGG